MAKQWMSQKQLKIKRYRAKKRGIVNRFSKGSYGAPSKNTGQGTAFDATTAGGRNQAAQQVNDPFLDRLFPGKPALEFRNPDELTKLVLQQHPRAIVLAILLQGEVRRQKPVKFVYHQIVKTDDVDYRLWMGGGIAFFTVEKTVGGITTIKKSIEYCQLGKQSGLDRALLAKDTKNITWLTVRKIPANQTDTHNGPT